MGTDKATLVVGGERLVERVARQLASVAEPVLVAPGRRDRLPGLPAAWQQVDDVVSDSGPLGGMAAVLAASPRPLVGVVAVDLIDLDAALLAWLASTWTGEDAAVPFDEHGRAQPLHAVYAASAGPTLAEAVRGGTRSVRDALALLAVREVPAHEWATRFAPGWSRNLNRPADL